MTLLLAVPSINTALREELDDLGMALPESDDGYHLITGALVPLVIIDLGAVAEREDDDVLRAFAGRPSRTLAAHRWMRQHQTLRSDTMSTRATPELEGYDDFVAFMLDGLSPEERMMGLKPEQRLAGLAPQERLAGLPPEQRLAGLAPERAALAFPTEALRALSAEYIATLPGDVQAEIRARLAR